MQKIIATLIILNLGLLFGVQHNEATQMLNPQFSGADLSIPKSINFQGYLYRDGNPMDTTMNMWFGIYDAPSVGNLLFQQTINNVIVTKGWFTVSLDNIPNSVFPVAGPTRYLEVKAPSTGQALLPRVSLVSVGYSYHSITSDTAEYAKAAPLSRPITPPIYSTEIRDTTIIETKLKDGSVTMLKINQSGATTGQVIKWTGTAWAPRNDSIAPPTGPAGGDLTGTYPNPTIANNAITSAKILNGTISGVDFAKPCTLQGAAPYPDGLLQIKNTGTGHGIRISPTNWLGVSIDSTGSHGVYVNKAEDAGVLVYRADDGFNVNYANRYGVYVNNSSIDGMKVSNAAEIGYHIEKAHTYGFVVDSAGLDGLRVGRATGNGVSVGRVASDGFSVDRADYGYGLHVGFSYYDGVAVESTNWSGLYVSSAGNTGVTVNDAHADGFRVYHAGGDGLFIYHADNNGVHVDSAGNYGVYARSTGNTPYAGVYGEGPTTTTGAYGVSGFANNNGVYGKSTYWEGVFGRADFDDAVEGYYNGTYSSYAGVRGRRGSYGYGVYYEGGIGGTGEKSTIVKTSKGPVALYSQESPENWFEDFGEGKLINGKAHIELDPFFLEVVNINEQYPMKVFVQLTSGEPMNLVVKKGLNGFDLITEDLTSNATFDYRVVAKRKGFEDLRLKTEEIGYTDANLYPDPNDSQIPAKIRAKRLEEIENRKKEEEIRKNEQLEKIRKEEKPSGLEKR
jgi:hypothetical protein